MHELRMWVGPGTALGGKSEAGWLCWEPEHSGRSCQTPPDKHLGEISVVPKVPFNLNTIRRQVRGISSFTGVAGPGLSVRLWLGVRRDYWCLPSGEQPGNSFSLLNARAPVSSPQRPIPLLISQNFTSPGGSLSVCSKSSLPRAWNHTVQDSCKWRSWYHSDG